MNDDHKEKHNTKDFKYCFFDSLNLLLTYSYSIKNIRIL